MKNSKDYDLKLNCQGNYVKSSINAIFLGLIIDDSISWKDHIDQMTFKLNTACFVSRTLQSIMTQETLIMVYSAYVHPTMSYGIIFWRNLPYSEKVFKMRNWLSELLQIQEFQDLCGELFKKKTEILLLYSQYIFFFINICDKKQTFILDKLSDS
jgi:hypothetical protein